METKEKIQAATLPEKACSNARNYADTKEKVASLVVSVPGEDGRFAHPVEARWYIGRSKSASVVYCSVWLRSAGGPCWSGRGTAGGGGYHKESAAFEDACRSAGVTFTKEVGGVGESAVREAALALAKALGYEGPMDVVTT
jgi:hypothetical protein